MSGKYLKDIREYFNLNHIDYVCYNTSIIRKLRQTDRKFGKEVDKIISLIVKHVICPLPFCPECITMLLKTYFQPKIDAFHELTIFTVRLLKKIVDGRKMSNGSSHFSYYSLVETITLLVRITLKPAPNSV